MRLQKIIQGLTLISKYYKNPNYYHMRSEHERIYMSAPDYRMSAEDYDILISNGWFQIKEIVQKGNRVLEQKCQEFSPDSDRLS